jgi:hypothetical protein
MSSGYSPVGMDAEVLILCDSVGAQFLRRLIYAADGSVSSTVDTTLAGAAFTPTGAVSRCTEPASAVTTSAHHFDAVPGAPWTTAAIPAGTTLVGLSYSVVLGTATVIDADGTSIGTIPIGYSANWEADSDSGTLTPPTSITAAAASRVLVLMRVR